LKRLKKPPILFLKKQEKDKEKKYNKFEG